MADLDNKFIKADFEGAPEMRDSVSSGHSVILALIDDIVRMQQNLDNMDISVKGVSQLRNRVKSMLTNLRSNGYEIAELIGRSVHEGDNMIGTWEPNEEMEPGTNRIKRVIRPQVSFRGKMIQAAEVVIEFNDK